MTNEYDLVLSIANLYKTRSKGQLVSALYNQLTDGLVFQYSGRPQELGRAKVGAQDKAQRLADAWYPALPDEYKTWDLASKTTYHWSSVEANRSFQIDLSRSYEKVRVSLKRGITNGTITKEMQKLMTGISFDLREKTHIDFSQYEFIFGLIGVKDPTIVDLISFVKFFTGHLYWLAMEEVNKRNVKYEMFKEMATELLAKVSEGSIKHDACGVIHRKVYFSEGYAIKIETSFPGGQHWNEASLWVNDYDFRLCPIEYIDNRNRLIIMRQGKPASSMRDIEKFYGIRSFEKGLKIGRNSCVFEIDDENNWAWFDGVPLIIDYGANNQG